MARPGHRLRDIALRIVDEGARELVLARVPEEDEDHPDNWLLAARKLVLPEEAGAPSPEARETATAQGMTAAVNRARREHALRWRRRWSLHVG